jgi:hypothetical protein
LRVRVFCSVQGVDERAIRPYISKSQNPHP